jgi:hypothetical protein
VVLARQFDLQEAGLVIPSRLARELIAPGNPARVFHRGVSGRRGLDMGMGQRVQAQFELLGRRGLPLLDQAARSDAQAAFQRSMAGFLIRERSLRELESSRVVLAQRLHGLESRNPRCQVDL